jgi:hypothetical protein
MNFAACLNLFTKSEMMQMRGKLRQKMTLKLQ